MRISFLIFFSLTFSLSFSHISIDEFECYQIVFSAVQLIDYEFWRVFLYFFLSFLPSILFYIFLLHFSLFAVLNSSNHLLASCVDSYEFFFLRLSTLN